MPRSSRHKSSHKSHRRSSPVDWSGSDEERESEPRVSRDSESEKRKSSHSKEVKESTNGYASSDHGKKRKERIESKDESGASDRWDSGLGRDGDADALVEKRSKGDVYSTVDTEKEKYLKEESKSRSSRKHDERNEEKRRYKEEKERDKEREKEKERGREKEKDKEREKEKESDREREREKDRDRERSSRREKYEEDKREKERYEGDRREKERYEEDKREKERHEEDKREKHRYDEVKREKEKYDEDKRDKERHDDAVVVRKRETETSRIEEANCANKDVDIITETDTTDREQREKHSKRRRDEISSDEKDREREREKDREREKEKERHRDDYSKSRSSKEHKSEPDKYKDKHRDKDRDKDDRREREYHDYKSSKEGNRSSESRKKSKGSEADLYDNRDEYLSKHKDGQGSKRNYEATEDRHERELEKEDVERSRGEYRYGEKEKEKEKEKVDSSPGKIRLKGSPGSSSYHDREQNRHRSKPVESPKKELMQEDRPRARTSSTGERTPSRLRDEKLNRPRDDAHSLELSSEIASSTPRSDTHASPKFATEKSPSNSSLKYSSGRGGSGSSKYRDRDRDREREFDVPTPDKLMIPKREPTPIGTSNRSNSSSNFAPLPYEDGDNRRESGPDRRFHKRGSHAHANNNWNGAPNWAAQVNNGFMPLPPGPPPPSGFHHFGGPPPPLFGIRPPPLKLGPSGVGVPFVHDPMDRFSGQLRGPYGWHNGGGNNPLVEDSFPPNLWGPAGNGVFGAEPFWDQNRPLSAWRAQSEMPNKELINVSQKEIGAPAPAIKMEEQVINENLPSESVDVKDDSLKGISSVETSVKDQRQQEVAPEVDKGQEASVKVGNFWESYISRIDISRELVDLEMLKKCTSALGELEKNIGSSDTSQANVMDGNEKRNGMSIIVLKSLFPISKDENFQKAMSLYNKLANRHKPERNNGLLGAPGLEESEVHSQDEESDMQVQIPATDNISPLGNDMEVDLKVSSNFVSDSDSIIFKNDEESEPVMKESSEDGLSRIPISTENTH